MKAPPPIPSLLTTRALVLARRIAIFGLTSFMPRPAQAFMMECHWPVRLSKVDFQEPLSERSLTGSVRNPRPGRPGDRLNIVVDSRRLPPDFLKRRVNYQAEIVTVR